MTIILPAPRVLPAVAFLGVCAGVLGGGCAPTPAARLPDPAAREPRPAAAPAPAPGLRLYQRDGSLYVTGPGAGHGIGGWFYVLSPRSIAPGGRARAALGVVRATTEALHGDSDTLLVRWVCPPKEAVALDGLPVEALGYESFLHQGRCWGRHLPGDPAGWSGARIRLFLDRGPDDGVQIHDRYEVLTADRPDRGLMHAVQVFRPIGVCVVERFNAGTQRSACSLSREDAPEFDQAAFLRGGFVHLLPADRW